MVRTSGIGNRFVQLGSVAFDPDSVSHVEFPTEGAIDVYINGRRIVITEPDEVAEVISALHLSIAARAPKAKIRQVLKKN